MTFWILLVIAIAITIIAFRWFNVLVSVVAAASWIALMAYNITNPPAGIVQGSFVHQTMILIFVGMAIAILITGIKNRNRKSEYNLNHTPEELEEISNNHNSGVMNLSPDEYKVYLRSKRTKRR